MKAEPTIDVTKLARRVAAARALARLPQHWIGDELSVGTALGMFGAVTCALVVALLYFSML